MTATFVDGSRKQLLEHTEEVEESLASAKPKSAQLATHQKRNEWCRGLENAVLDLCNVLAEGTADFEARLLLQYTVDLRRLILEDVESSDGDDGRIELKRLQMLDVLKRMERRIHHGWLDNPETAARYVFKALENLSTTEIAELLGVTTKTIGAWRSGTGKPVKQNAIRVTYIAQILFNLGQSMTSRGMWLWFHSSQDRLEGRSPLQLLIDGLETNNQEWVMAVQALARGGRGQLAD